MSISGVEYVPRVQLLRWKAKAELDEVLQETLGVVGRCRLETAG